MNAPCIHTLHEGLDLCKISCVFGQGAPFCLLSMELLCQSKGIEKSLLMMSIVKGAMGSMSMIGTYDLTGIDLGREVASSPKVSSIVVGITEVDAAEDG